MTINNTIPAGWRKLRLGDICSFYSGGTPSKNNPKYWNNGTIKWLSAKYIENNKVIGWDLITDEGLYACKITNKGDIILVTRVSIGKLLLCNEPFAVNQDLTIIKTNKVNNLFLFNVLQQKNREIIDKSQGLAIKGITKESLADILFLLPPLAEQEKIAGILGTWDEAIEKLSDLIEQKKLLKKGLMQKLLTGKTRLPGFTQPWKEVKLGEIAEFILGYSFDSNDFKENGIPLIRISNIEDDKLSLDKDTVFLDTSSLQKYQKYCIKQQDLLIAMSGATTGKMGINKTVTPMLLNQRVGIIRAKKSNQCFINQYLMRFNNKILRMSYGGAQPNIGSNDIKKIKLFIPSDISEQQAIADVLSTADDEINLLNQKLEALKTQKKGLMQQLLTGKIRVKEDK